MAGVAVVVVVVVDLNADKFSNLSKYLLCAGVVERRWQVERRFGFSRFLSTYLLFRLLKVNVLLLLLLLLLFDEGKLTGNCLSMHPLYL